MLDTENPDQRVVLRLAPDGEPGAVHEPDGDFQEFVASVRSDTGDGSGA